MRSTVIHSGIEIPVMQEPKDPNASLDYGFDYVSQWLQSGEIIVTSTWNVPEGLFAGTEDFDAGHTSIFLSGGYRKRKYLITNRITTNLGRTEDRSFYLLVDNK